MWHKCYFRDRKCRYIRVRGLVLRNDTVNPCSETIDVMIKFCGHVFDMIWRSYLNLYAGEIVKIKPGDLMVVILYKSLHRNFIFLGWLIW